MFLSISRAFLCRSGKRILSYLIKEQMAYSRCIQTGSYPVIEPGLFALLRPVTISAFFPYGFAKLPA